MGIGSKGGGGSPATPDYAGAARATAQGNLDLAKYTTQANRINQSNPYGSVSYSQDPSGQWSQQTSLSPVQQNTLNAFQNMQGGALQNIQDKYSQPFDMGSVQDIANKSYQNYTARLDPQWNQRQSALETQLANQGIAPGTEAYTNAMRDFNAGRNDAYTQAQNASFNLMPQTYNLATAARSQPLQEYGQMQSTMMPGTPTFGQFAQQNQVAGPDILGATNAQYQSQLGASNAANANQSNMFGGLMGLGGSLLGGIGSAGGWSKFWG